MSVPNPIDYASLADGREVEGPGWEELVDEVLLDIWLARYRAMTAWAPRVSEIGLGSLTYLFDAAPTMASAGDSRASDRVVVVWGRSERAAGPRDRSRLSGFLPGSQWWSRGRDRGHLVAHAIGGGLDLNLFPQARGLNRGLTPAGKRWRAMERRAFARSGAPLFVRPIYDSPSWTPEELEFGLVEQGRLQVQCFANRD